MEITGKLIVKFDTQQITEKFKKREFVVEYAENPEYPELLKFELVQDKCEVLDAYQVGDSITVAYNLRGRKYTKDGNDMYFNSLQAWKLSKAGGEPVAPTSSGEPAWLNKSTEGGDESDLPF